MNNNYRHEARQHVKRAKAEIDSLDDERLKYAALELRMSMEALTYERALAYKDEFPPAEYETWQPRKVMKVLLDIDPSADKDSSIAFGVEKEYGVAAPAPAMPSLGGETVLNMKTLRKHYDALGSYLHTISLKKVRLGEALDFEKFRMRCENLTAYLESVLASPVFNITLGNFATLECIECSKSIRKRIPFGKTEVEAVCYECRASYTLVAHSEDNIECIPHWHKVICANEQCSGEVHVWHHQLEAGRNWVCSECEGQNTFVLAIQHDAPTNDTSRM
jgi:hypothetical protein